MQRQCGFGAILSLIIVAISLLLGGFFLHISQNYLTNSKQNWQGLVAKNLAEAGIEQTLVKLSKVESFPPPENLVSGEKILFAKSPTMATSGKYRTYIALKGKGIILLSIGEFAGIKRQVMVDLIFSGEPGRYSVLCWHTE